MLPVEIIRFLYDKLQETGWPFKAEYCGRGCDCLRGYVCEDCGASTSAEHKASCSAVEVLQQIEAFLRAEEESPCPP